MSPSEFQTAVLNWFDQHGRTHLPWQQDISAYRVWVSEIMLQQTRVAQGMSYYLAFSTVFPTVEDLANAEESKVLKMWAITQEPETYIKRLISLSDNTKQKCHSRLMN